MGIELFGVDIAGIVADVVGPGVSAATLIKFTPGERIPGMAAHGTNATTASYACRGFEVSLEERFVDGDTVKRTDVAVVLLGDTIARGAVAPTAGDRLTIGGKTWALISLLERDPAAATYTFAMRKG